MKSPISIDDCISVGCKYGKTRKNNSIFSCEIWNTSEKDQCKCCLICRNIGECDREHNILAMVEPLARLMFSQKYLKYRRYSRSKLT